MTISRQFLKKFLAYAGGYLLFLLLMGFIFRQDLLTAGFPWLHLPTLSVYVAYLLIYCGCFCLPLYLIRYFHKRRAYNLVRQKKVAANFQLGLQIILILLAVCLLIVLLSIIWTGQCQGLSGAECQKSLVCYSKVYVSPGSVSGFIQRSCVPYLFKLNPVEVLSNYFTGLTLAVYFFTMALSLVYLGVIKIHEYKFLKKTGRLVAGILILLGGILALGWAGIWLLFIISTIL